MEKELIQAINNLGDKFDMLIEIFRNNISFPSYVANTQPKEKCKYTFFEWLDKWFKEFKAITLKDGGYDMQNTINKHIKTNILDKPLDEYDGVIIQESVNKVQSKRMGQIVHSIYNQCFQSAVDFDYITKNPVEKVGRPKHEIEQGRALTKDEHRLFLYESKKSELYPLFKFYLLTGCRKVEALTIKWEDITDTELFIKGTKTKNAVRRLPIYPQLKQLINSIKKHDEYLFPYGSDGVRYEFEKIRNKLPFKDFTIHSLRHTFATRCLESGISLKTVQKWLGHADYMTTANIYSHITTEFEHEEIGRLSQNTIALKSDKF